MHERSFPVRLWAFTRERFPPATHGLYGFLLTASVAAVGYSLGLGRVSAGQVIVAALVCTLVLFILRVLDDVKDLDTDRQYHPDRPLVRQVITVSEALRVAVVCEAVVIITTAVFSLCAVPAAAILGLHSYLLYKGYYRRQWIERRIVLFVFSHAAIGLVLVLFLHGLLFDTPIWMVPRAVLWHGAVVWCSSALYDCGRKLFAPKEPEFGSSYSSVLGVRLAAVHAFGWGIALALALTVLGRVQEFEPAYFLFVYSYGVLTSLAAVAASVFGRRRLVALSRAACQLGMVLAPLMIVGVVIWASR